MARCSDLLHLPTQLCFNVYIFQHLAVLHSSLLTRVVRFGSIRCFAALIHAVASRPVAPQSSDLFSRWITDCSELREYVLHCSALAD